MLCYIANCNYNTDNNECQTDNGSCAQQCINTPGSYHCSCDDGFELTSDAHSCVGKYLCVLIIYQYKRCIVS